MKTTVVNKMLEANRNIKVIRHETIEELFAAEWQSPIEELKLCKLGGVDESGNELELNFNKIIHILSCGL